MPCGKILNTMKEKPKNMEGKTFIYKKNPKNKLYVKFKKIKKKK